MRRPAVTSCTAPPAPLAAARTQTRKFGAGTRTRNPAIATATAKDGRVPALHPQASNPHDAPTEGGDRMDPTGRPDPTPPAPPSPHAMVVAEPGTRTARLASPLRLLHRWAAVAVAALVTIEIVRTYQHGDPRGIAAVAAIVGTTVALYLATTAREVADTLTTLAAQAAAGVAALEEIENSLAEVEHAAGLAEESLDLLATAAASLTGLAGTVVAGEVRAG